MVETPTDTAVATAVATATAVAVQVVGYTPDAISVGDAALVGLLLFGFGILIVLGLLLLLRRNI